MAINVPKKHHFPDDLKGEILEITGFLPPDWEIAVQKKDDVAWSIVLSFLISANHRDPDDFSRRLVALTSSDKNLDLVKTAIGTFNPFRDRFSCFFNEALQQVVTEFKEKLRWETLRRRISCKLFAASKRLGCTILHIWRERNSFKYKVYCEARNNKLIFIFSSDYTSDDNVLIKCVNNFLTDHNWESD